MSEFTISDSLDDFFKTLYCLEVLSDELRRFDLLKNRGNRFTVDLISYGVLIKYYTDLLKIYGIDSPQFKFMLGIEEKKRLHNEIRTNCIQVDESYYPLDEDKFVLAAVMFAFSKIDDESIRLKKWIKFAE